MSAMLHFSITTQVSAFCSFAASQLPHRELNDVSRQSGRSNKHNWRHVQAACLRCLGTALCDEIVDRRISCGKPGVARQREALETRQDLLCGVGWSASSAECSGSAVVVCAKAGTGAAGRWRCQAAARRGSGGSQKVFRSICGAGLRRKGLVVGAIEDRAQVRRNIHRGKGAHRAASGVADRQAPRQIAERCKRKSQKLLRRFRPVGLSGISCVCGHNG